MMKQRKPILAGLASLGTPGLGQLYNGKLRKAVIMYCTGVAVACIGLIFPPAYSFSYLVILLAAAACVSIVIIVDAFRDARKLGEVELRPYNRWYIYLAILLVQFFPVGLVLEYVSGFGAVKTFDIPTASMSPTIQRGDYLAADMEAYAASNPKRGDIVIFRYPRDERQLYIKRVIALPGETVEIRGKQIFINNAVLADPWGTFFLADDSLREPYGPATLGEAEYFLVGDNRDDSLDSRHFGAIKKSKITAQARYIYWAEDKNRIGTHLL
jgi:signal peptidase I